MAVALLGASLFSEKLQTEQDVNIEREIDSFQFYAGGPGNNSCNAVQGCPKPQRALTVFKDAVPKRT